MTTRLLITACFLVFANSTYGQGLRSDQVAASMTVRVYNYSTVARSELNLAEAVAARIFRESGVQVVWYDCGPSSLTNDDPRCGQRTSLTTFDLRICRSCTSLRTSEYGVRGYVVGSMATVSTTWSDEISQSLYVPSEYLLGRVIVHELGHLLLGPGHSPVGIMKAHWTREDLRRTNLGMLSFTSEQVALISSNLECRRAVKDEAVALEKFDLWADSTAANK